MKKEDPKTKSILPPPPPHTHGRQDMGLKTPTHAGQANPNPNLKAQANTLSAKPLSPFKPKSAVKQSQTKPIPQTQTEPVPKSQIVGLSKTKQIQTKEPQPLSPSQEPTLSPSRRQFIEQYGAYALVTPVALYAMMSPNRAMAQAGSVAVVADDAVVDARPTVLRSGERIENFDIDTHIDGYIDVDGDLALVQGQKYTAPDGVVYTCAIRRCYITPTAGGGGKVVFSELDITYPDNIGSSDQAADDIVDDATDDPVVDARPKVLNDQERIENFDVTTKTDGEVTLDGDLLLKRGAKYIAPDGVVYTCSSDVCIIMPTAGGGGKANNYNSTFDITYPVAADTTDDAADTAVAVDDDPADDPVDDVAATDVVVVAITDGYVVPNFDISRHTDGYIDQGELVLNRNQKYIGVDGKHYTCAANFCTITSDGYVLDI